MKIRHSNHKQEVKKVTGGLGHHYGGPGGCGYDNLTLTIIEQVEEKNMEFLAKRELYWQHQLRVYIEKKNLENSELSSAQACFEVVFKSYFRFLFGMQIYVKFI